jgi:3-hydroxyanthranilate 3,4-dioxygenase
MLLKTIRDGRRVDIPIREGEILLLPPKVPHSPQRLANTVGLVVERKRLPHELDGFMWFCDNCHHKLYEEYVYLNDIVGQLPPIFDRFYGSEDNRTCANCGAVTPVPGS